MKKNIVNKLLAQVVIVMVVLSLSLGIMQIPFVAASYIIEHPISVVCDFLFDFLGIDIASTENLNIYQLADKYYEGNKENKEVFDSILKEYEEVSSTNLAIPFVIFQYKSVKATDVELVANWLKENASDGLSEDNYIDFMISEQVFENKRKTLKYDKEVVSSLFGQDFVEGSDDGDEISPGELELGNKIAKKAYTRLGCRYWWGAPGGGFGDKQRLDDPNAKYFDCSGFVAWAHRQSGVKIGRTTAVGYSKSGQAVSYENLQTGDVITFSYDNGKSVAHIGIYIGDGQMIHASGQGSGTRGQYANQKVKTQSIAPGSYYYKYIYNCRRLF